MKCPYCGWGVVDGKCVRCMAEVKEPPKEIKKPTNVEKEKEKKNGN